MKRRYNDSLFFASFLFVGLSVGLCAAEPKNEITERDFIRVTQLEGKRHPQSLDTAIVTFSSADKNERRRIRVDLISAVHIGDKKYYDDLNKQFKKYDVVLYELVAEQGVRPGTPKSAKVTNKSETSRSGVSSLQGGMGAMLSLDFQLDHIDYHAKNFVHADLSPEAFAKRVAERGDIMQIIFRAFLLGLKKESEGQNEELKMQGRMLGSFFATDSSLSLKRVSAKVMVQQLEDSNWLLGGGDEGSAILTDRNDAALAVLQKQIKNGKKSIAIFYGGAHMPDMAKKLEKKFNLKRADTVWMVAWDLTSDQSARKSSEK